MQDSTKALDRQALECAKAHTGGIAWPTIALALATTAAFGLVLGLAVSGKLPTWIAIIALSYLVYASYTPLHEAVHRNISNQQPGLGWLDYTVGSLVSMLIGVSYTMHRSSHFTHHSKTNDEQLDPDMVFGHGSPLQVLIGSLKIVPAGYIWYFRHGWPNASGVDRGLFLIETSIILGSRIVPALLGYPMEVLLLGIIPNLLGVMLTAVSFAWVVHHPHDKQARYQTTSTFLLDNWLHWPMTVLWLWQNYHSIHHLFPRVPFYRYHKVFAGIRETMAERGAPIYVIGGRSPQPADQSTA